MLQLNGKHVAVGWGKGCTRTRDLLGGCVATGERGIHCKGREGRDVLQLNRGMLQQLARERVVLQWVNEGRVATDGRWSCN